MQGWGNRGTLEARGPRPFKKDQRWPFRWEGVLLTNIPLRLRTYNQIVSILEWRFFSAKVILKVRAS